MYRQLEKNLLSSNYVFHMSLQYGELRPTSSWDLLTSSGHPCKFQRVSTLGSVTARHASSGRQSNFAALRRVRHRYSTGRPSRWALAHVLVQSNLYHVLHHLLPTVSTMLAPSNMMGCIRLWSYSPSSISLLTCAVPTCKFTWLFCRATTRKKTVIPRIALWWALQGHPI